jgi:hypothetical protein
MRVDDFHFDGARECAAQCVDVAVAGARLATRSQAFTAPLLNVPRRDRAQVAIKQMREA